MPSDRCNGRDRCRTPGSLSRFAPGWRADHLRAARSIIAAGPGVGQIMSPALWKHRSSTLPGWTACRTVFRTVRPPKHCGRSAISISLNSKRSSAAATAKGQKPSLPLPGRLAPVGLDPARRCVSSPGGALRAARGPAYGLPAQATAKGGQCWTMGVNIQRRLTATCFSPGTVPKRCMANATMTAPSER